MKETPDITAQELDELFERYRQSPDSHVFVLVADACRKLGRIEEALEVCQTGIERHREYASGYVVKGKCMYDLERYVEAQTEFEEVLSIDANNLVALKYLGMIAANAGRFDSARDYLEHILRLDPENTEIKKALEDVDEQQQDESQDESQDEGEPSPQPEEIVAPAGDDAKAPAAGVIDIEIEQSDELATITLADIYASQGYHQKAQRIYEELLAKELGNENIKKKLAALAGLETNTAAGDEPIAPPLVIEGYYASRADQPSEHPASEDAAGQPSDDVEPGDADDDQQEDPVPARAAKTPKKKAKRAADAEVSDPPAPDVAEQRNINLFKQWLGGIRR